MLPGLDGFEVCRALGRGPDRTPIIMLTARTGHDDKVRGLELGADDYVTKPFAFDELFARINAVLRRSHPRLDRIVLGDIEVDFRRYRASRGGRDLALTHREVELLHYLAERAGRVVTREELLRLVWRYSDVPATRTVDNFIARLRRKIEPDPHHPPFIRTVHGDGYSLTTPGLTPMAGPGARADDAVPRHAAPEGAPLSPEHGAAGAGRGPAGREKALGLAAVVGLYLAWSTGARAVGRVAGRLAHHGRLPRHDCRPDAAAASGRGRRPRSASWDSRSSVA